MVEQKNGQALIDPRFRPEIQESGMGLLLGYSGFSHNQNNFDVSSVYVTFIYCGLSMKIACVECRTTRKDRGYILRSWQIPPVAVP